MANFTEHFHQLMILSAISIIHAKYLLILALRKVISLLVRQAKDQNSQEYHIWPLPKIAFASSAPIILAIILELLLFYNYS